jgi:mannose-6-phosphate isomerase-like protein (cupin superfamily)
MLARAPNRSGKPSHAEPYRNSSPDEITRHFFQHKGDEIGYLIAGELRMTYRDREYKVAAGDFIYINEGWPSAWENTGKEPARLLWLVTGCCYIR